MPRPARLAMLLEPDRVGAVLARRRIAARLCMGQSVPEMARLEGVSVARMVEIIHHPTIRTLACLWMAFLGRMRRVEGLDPFLGHALRLAEHELETGNAGVAVFLCRLWAFAGSPARGLLEYVAKRFCRLALLDKVQHRRPPATSEAPPPPRPEVPPAVLAERSSLRAMLARARAAAKEWGGLDLRYLPMGHRRGIPESLFRKLAHVLEQRGDILGQDRPAFAPPAPDPGPFWPRRRGGRCRVWAPDGTTGWRFQPPGEGRYAGAFPVLPSGRVLPATFDLAYWKLELPFEPWGEGEPIKTARARRWAREQKRLKRAAARTRAGPARASPQAA